jgi:hypothetical protein
MKKITKLILGIAAATYVGFTFSQPQKTLIGFQNIPWGSSVDAIKAKFPNAKKGDICKVITSNQADYLQYQKNLSADNVSCSYLYVEKYDIQGDEYLLSFDLDRQNKLAFVSLTLRRQENVSQNYINECNTAYLKAARLLESRYGEGFVPLNISDFSKDYVHNTALGWTPLPTEIWIANRSGHKLTRDLRGISEDKSVGKDFCIVKVNYSNRSSGAASKL